MLPRFSPKADGRREQKRDPLSGAFLIATALRGLILIAGPVPTQKNLRDLGSGREDFPPRKEKGLKKTQRPKKPDEAFTPLENPLSSSASNRATVSSKRP
jgi:hypothetical protein